MAASESNNGVVSRRCCLTLVGLGVASTAISGAQGANAMMPSETAARAQGYGLRVVSDNNSRDAQLVTEQVRRAAWEIVRRRFPTAIALADNDQRLASPSLIIISLNVGRASVRTGPSDTLDCVVISGRLVRAAVSGSLKPAEIEIVPITDFSTRITGQQSILRAFFDRLLR